MADVDTKDLLEQMSNAREIAEELRTKKSRLSGELETYENRIKEMEKECVDKFGIPVTELQDKIETLRKESLASLKKAKDILGVTDE
jgi:hypothetical protein